MRYLVHARVKSDRAGDLLQAIENRTLGAGSVAGSEYLRDMQHARLLDDGSVRWVEVCFCFSPLEEELPYWEEYFDLSKVMNAHNREKCLDLTGDEPWACTNCDCTDRLEETMEGWGVSLLTSLRAMGTEENVLSGLATEEGDRCAEAQV